MMDIGERLKSYEPLWENWYIDSWIYSGSYGTVYKLKQDLFGEITYSAVKIIPNILSDNFLMRENKDNLIREKKLEVIQEIKNMHKLHEKPYLVQCIAHSIKDVFDEKGNIVGFDVLIQMNYYTSISKYMKENGELSVHEIIKIAEQIGMALKSMHDINMLHRDIKPENIFINENGDYLIGDFGVSKQVETNSYSTQIGTTPYIAPEVFKVEITKKNYTKVADIYSFGITLYYLLNNNCFPLINEKSSDNEIEDAVYDRLNGKEFPPPRNGFGKLNAIVMKCCEYRQEDRYQSMNEILKDLTEIDAVPANSVVISPSNKKTITTNSYDMYKTTYADDFIKIKDRNSSISIVAISAGDSHTVGLKSDGTVAAVGYNHYGQCDVSGWTDIIAISAGTVHTVGIKSDGTIVATDILEKDCDYGQCDMLNWEDIVSVSTSVVNTVGLKSDGTVVSTLDGRYDASTWINIVAISAGNSHTVGLKSDGTVVAVGYNDYGRCDVSGWTDIIAISAGDIHTVGLKSDGTVVAVGCKKNRRCKVSRWTNIVSISAGANHTVGLKSDGTVVATGYNKFGQCNVSKWKNIVAVSAGSYCTLGLKSDGTVVAVGDNRFGQCDFSDWTDIKTNNNSGLVVNNETMDDNIITLNDEFGHEAQFEFLDFIEYNSEEYVVLLPVNDEKGLVLILKAESINGDNETYIPVKDDNIVRTVFQIFKDRFKNTYDFIE